MLEKKNSGGESKLILATGAHFDDVETGVGGTLLRHIDNGDKVKIIIMNSDEFRTGDPKIRYEEQLSAVFEMGLKKEDLILFTSKDAEADIIFSLDKMNCDFIYTPYEKDTHQDHRRCSKISQSVGRKRNITTIFYYCGSSVEFYPNLFSVFDYERKMKLIDCHKTQIQCGALKLDRRKKMEAYWATLISDDEKCYAEGFIVRKMKLVL